VKTDENELITCLVLSTGHAYDIQHGGIGRDLIELQEVGAANRSTVVCDLYEFGYFIEPGTTLRFPKRWSPESKLEILNGRTGGGESLDEDDDVGTFVDWVDGVAHPTKETITMTSPI
jgi:hypothetical protein